MSSRFSQLLAFVLVLGLPAVCQAESERLFSTNISPATVDNLAAAADGYLRNRSRVRVGFSLPTPNGPLNLQLEPHDIRADRYRATRSTANGRIEDDVQVDLFRGPLGVENTSFFSRFALTRLPDGTRELKGFVFQNQVFYEVTQDKKNSRTLHVGMLSEESAAQIAAACGTKGSEHEGAPELFHTEDDHDHSAERSGEVGEMNLKVIELATDADFEYFTQEGSLTNANAAILAILNAVDAIYRAELDLQISVVFQNVWTTGADPYFSSNPNTILNEFTNYWNSNFSGAVTYDLAHLWTGKDLDGSTVGIAWVRALCGSVRYGVSMRLNSMATDVPLVAHEIGHNVGSNHDDPCAEGDWIMCAFLQSNANKFSATSKSSIGNHVSASSCLSDGGPGGGNSDPVLEFIGPREVQETDTLTITLSASDVDGDSFSFSASPIPTGGSFSGNSFRYTPPQGTVDGGSGNKNVTVTITVTDVNGGTDSEAVVISVTKKNRAPSLANPGSPSTAEGTLFNFQLQGTDPDGDPLSYTAVNGLPAGAAVDSASGVFSWKPAGDQAGTYALQFQVSDGFGGTAVATMNLTVNDAPGVSPLPTRHALGDFDGDGKADFAVYRYGTGEWFSASEDGVPAGAVKRVQWGGQRGDITVPADYDGDRITDYAIFRKASSTWYIVYSGNGLSTVKLFGLDQDIPAPGDFDGDGRDDIAVFRASLGQFIYQPSSSPTTSSVVVTYGQRGDIPVPCDYDGDGDDDIALYRPANGTWYVLGGTTVVLGTRSDIPVPADYNGDGRCEPAVFQNLTATWVTKSGESLQFGWGGDVPTPSDYDGDGDDEPAVYRASQALWYHRQNSGGTGVYQLGLVTDQVPLRETFYYAARTSKSSFAFARSDEAGQPGLYRSAGQSLFSFSLIPGAPSTVPAPPGSYVVRGDYDGDGSSDTAVFYYGYWAFYYANGTTGTGIWGTYTDRPVTGDFDGDGTTDVAVYRPDNGGGIAAWYIIFSSTGAAGIYSFGSAFDTPIAADFNADGYTDIAVFSPFLGWWWVLDSRSGWLTQVQAWGFNGAEVRVADFDEDGRSDKIAYFNGAWYMQFSSGGTGTLFWGIPGDIPVPGTYFSPSSFDYAVWRPSDGTLYVLSQTGSALGINPGYLGTDQISCMKPYRQITY